MVNVVAPPSASTGSRNDLDTKACAQFSWAGAPYELDGLPGGPGLKKRS